MSKKSVSKALLLLTSILLMTAFVAPVLAHAQAHLWFYSVDPDTIPAPAPQPLPDPQLWDPNYVGIDPDPWTADSVNLPSDFDTPFTFWLACKQKTSDDTKLVISINDAAFAAILSVTVNGIPIGVWN